ncbi:MAG: ComF family protein [Xenococcaceae cyanobacterium MO_188.B32]|nr:ComF family protein [Xenococcaceae cyanobacterium MO_188.B32]
MLRSLLSLFVQSLCPLCQRQTQELICTYCQQKIRGHHLSAWEIETSRDLPIFAWGKYEGHLKRAIAQIKYENKPELGILLGEWLGQSWLNTPQGKKIRRLTVVPIPLHQHKLKLRGFNQSTKIARGFCQVTGYTLNPHALIRVRNTEAMFGLNSQQRQENIHNAFRINKNFNSTVARSPILLLDDIYTTGSTIKEACQALTQNSLKVCGAAVIAIASFTNIHKENQKY